MNITISAKNIEITQAIRDFVEDKIGGLEKLIGHSKASASVEIGKPSKHHRSGEVFYSEVNLKLGGNLLRAEAQRDDLYAAIIEVKDELQIQIKKFKDKHSEHR